MANGKRSVVLAAGMLLQLCAGIVYMWSVFKGPVEAYLNGWDSTFTSSIMLAAFVVGIVGGGVLQRLGPRNVLIGGSLLFSLGMILTSLINAANPSMIYLTYGVIAGLGVGVVYTTTVSVVQKWFPDRRGFATGMMVSAFGFSLVIFTPIASALLASRGVPFTFTAIGILFLIVCTLSALLVNNPPADFKPAGAAAAKAKPVQRHYTTGEMLRTAQFYKIFFGMMLILPAYFILNPQFKALGAERGLSEAFRQILVMTTGVASATGRLLFSWASDRIGRKNAIYCIIGVTLVGVLTLIVAQGFLFMVCVALIAFAFGGCASVFPALTADNFGTKYMGFNYGCVMVGFGVAALGAPVLAKQLPQDAAHTWWFAMAAALCLVALVCIALIRKPKIEA